MGRRPAAPLRCIGQPSDVEARPCSPPRCSEIGRMTARRWQSVPPTREYEILLDMARTWTRLVLQAEEWQRENSPRRRWAKRALTRIAGGSCPPLFLRLPPHRESSGFLKPD